MEAIWKTLPFPDVGYSCWVLKDSAHYTPTIDVYNASRTILQLELPPYLWQSDFERLYTELLQPDLKLQMANFIMQVFALHPGKVLVLSLGKAGKWK